MLTKRQAPRALSWCQISDEAGPDLGRFAIDGESMIVQSAEGWTKTVRAGPAEAWAGLARLVVSEPPPPHWRKP